MDPSQLLQIFSFYSAVSSWTSLLLILGINAYSSWFLLFQISVFFDLLFMGQHFVLYPAKGALISPKTTKEESAEPLVKSSDDPVSENVWSLWLLNSEDISWHLSCRIGISQLYMYMYMFLYFGRRMLFYHLYRNNKMLIWIGSNESYAEVPFKAIEISAHHFWTMKGVNICFPFVRNKKAYK